MTQILQLVKGAVSRNSVIFALFLREQKMATARASVADISSICRANGFTARLSRANVVFLEQVSFSAALFCGRHYFSHTKWLPKITDYRDTAALKIQNHMKIR